MEKSYKDPEIQRNLDFFRNRASELKNGTGSIICVKGEIGFGKTHLLNLFMIECSKNPDIVEVFADTQAPIGNFNVGNIRPLQPFTQAMEKIMNYKGSTASGKFAKNMLLTGLSLVPIAGDVFWAIKEAGKDWREYKKDQSSQGFKKVSTATADYFDSINNFADKNPIVILMDDMHWADAQSVELLNMLADKIEEIRLIIVLACRMDAMRSQVSPMTQFIEDKVGKAGRVYSIELKPFDKYQLREVCQYILPNYPGSKQFESWLYDNSLGVPGVVMEYLKYFSENPPFDEDGNIKEEVLQTDFIPTSVQSTFSHIINKLNSEERNTLSICSAEGREFTAMIVSELLNTDVLTAIRKLRALQEKTGVIKSLGAKHKYGVKTTTYRFTQGFYHTFFEKSLEYEEHLALHGQIASLLKQKYEEAEDEYIREEIAPYLAAHSSESGDEETTKSMLLKSAEAAKKYGSADIIKAAYDNFVNVGNIEGIDKSAEKSDDEKIDSESIAFREMMRAFSSEEKPEGEASEEIAAGEEGTISDQDTSQETQGDTKIGETSFAEVRKAIVKEYHRDNFHGAASLAVNFLEGRRDDFDPGQQAQLLSLAAKANIELEQFELAEEQCSDAHTKASGDSIPECFVLNTYALLRFRQKRTSDSLAYLQDAASKTMSLPQELRLLTLANIAKVMEEVFPENAKRYYDAALHLSRELSFGEFTEDIY